LVAFAVAAIGVSFCFMRNGHTPAQQLEVLWETAENPEAEERVLSAFELLLVIDDAQPRFDRTHDREHYENKGPQ